jgi:hypothetical protein
MWAFPLWLAIQADILVYLAFIAFSYLVTYTSYKTIIADQNDFVARKLCQLRRQEKEWLLCLAQKTQYQQQQQQQQCAPRHHQQNFLDCLAVPQYELRTHFLNVEQRRGTNNIAPRSRSRSSSSSSGTSSTASASGSSSDDEDDDTRHARHHPRHRRPLPKHRSSSTTSSGGSDEEIEIKKNKKKVASLPLLLEATTPTMTPVEEPLAAPKPTHQEFTLPHYMNAFNGMLNEVLTSDGHTKYGVKLPSKRPHSILHL